MLRHALVFALAGCGAAAPKEGRMGGREWILTLSVGKSPSANFRKCVELGRGLLGYGTLPEGGFHLAAAVGSEDCLTLCAILELAWSWKKTRTLLDGTDVSPWEVKMTLDGWRRKRAARGRKCSRHCQSPTAQAAPGHPERVTLPCCVHAGVTSPWAVEWAAHAVGPKGITGTAGMLDRYRALVEEFPFRWCPGFEPLANIRLIERLPVSRTAYVERTKRAAARWRLDFEALVALAVEASEPAPDEEALNRELVELRELEASVAAAKEQHGAAWLATAVGQSVIERAARDFRAPELLTFDRETAGGRVALVARLVERIEATKRVLARVEQAEASPTDGAALSSNRRGQREHRRHKR